MSGITTHVLDTTRGRPAADVGVTLQRQLEQEHWETLGSGRTEGNGRLRTPLVDTPLRTGIYRLTFDTNAYFALHGTRTFYPHVIIDFEVADPQADYHVPLLLSAFGYTTYRGS